MKNCKTMKNAAIASDSASHTVAHWVRKLQLPGDSFRADAITIRGTWLVAGLVLLIGVSGRSLAQGGKDVETGKAASKASSDATGAGIQEAATPVSQLKIAKGFRVDLLYSVPRDQQGSWVNLCVDPRGRLIVSDQYGGLYRVNPPEMIGAGGATRIEKIPVELGEAQGLLWAFDSLYVVVNRGQKYASGLYRVRDTDGDDQLDEVKMLRPIQGGGEHGPHAVLLTPDGKSLMVVCGNQTKLMEYSKTRVPPIWGEDHLLPRMPDGRGFMRGVLGPGGAIYRVDPEGKEWELVSVGFRNQYDAAFNRHGELFTYDADMEWDFNTPWYRPTRVCLVTSGSEFGWRNGAGKWPAYYADSLPSVVDIGPGSPTGITFGYGAKFPAKFQEALFICDWSYGKMYAVHLESKGSGYGGVVEEFVTGSPLPLTDVVVSPRDGAMYFTIGGRKTQSGLYRVTYSGNEPATPVGADGATETDRDGAAQRAIRHALEAVHHRADQQAVDLAWQHLGQRDRFLRFAARVALEHQDLDLWRDRALAEKDPDKAITALLALVRSTSSDPFHRAAGAAAVDAGFRRKVLTRLHEFASADWQKMRDETRLEYLRTLQITLNRMEGGEVEQLQALAHTLEGLYPAGNRFENAELCQLLVYLKSQPAIGKSLTLLEEAPTQEEQMEYARALRVMPSGWTMDERKRYFAWFQRAANYRGGASFANFVKNIKDDAIATLTASEKTELEPVLAAAPVTAVPATAAANRPFVKKRSLENTASLFAAPVSGRNFERGRKLFAAANCFACHRFDNEGGAHGPDLTGLAGRFGARDLLESVIDPGKVISDQYAGVLIETRDGRAIAGRIVNLNDDNLMIMPNMLDPNAIETVKRSNIETMIPSTKSLMPDGLLDTFEDDEVLDLMAYLLSRGDRQHAMFRKN